MSSPAVTTIHHRLTAPRRAAEAAAAAIPVAVPHTAADTAPTAVAAVVPTAAADADKTD